MEQAHSSLRASPLGSVLDAVTVPVADTSVTYSTPAAPPSIHEITSSSQRHSPAGSVHSSSLFSSGLPSPIMSPRGRSQSDTGVAVASRGSPLGSIHIQTQPPLRPQSLGGSVSLSETVPISVEILTNGNSASHLESRRGPISGAEGPSIPPVLRQSPTGSNHSTSVHPQVGAGQADDASRHSSQRSTPVLSVHSEPPARGSPFVAPPRTLYMSHRGSGDDTPSMHNVRQRTSGAESPTELSLESVYRQDSDTAAVASRNGSTAATPVMSPTGSRESQSESESSTPSVHSPRHRTSGAGSPSELLAERAFRQGTSPAATPPVNPSRSSRVSHGESESSTPSVNSPRHRTSGAGSPSELLAERAFRQGTSPAATPPVNPSRSSRVSHGETESSTPSVNSPRHRTSGAGSPSELLAERAFRQGTSPAATPPVNPSRSSRVSHGETESSTPSVNSPRHRTSGAGSPSELLAERAFRQGISPVVSRNGSSAAAPLVKPLRSSRVSHGESESSAPSVNSPRRGTSGTGSPSELLAESYRRGSPPVPSHSGPSRASRGQSPASSIRSRGEGPSRRVLYPPLSHESDIPSRGSAFAAVNGERGPSASELSSEVEALREERDTLANELRQRAAHYEAELRRVKCRNEDLEQQMLSIEVSMA